MKFDIKGFFVLDAILGMIIGILINKLMASITVGGASIIPGLPQVIPAGEFAGITYDTVATLIICALPAIMHAGRIGTIFKWAFYTELTFTALNVINSLTPTGVAP